MNSYVKASPVAGTAAALVFVHQLWLLAVAVTVVGTAVLAIRLGWRRHKALSDR